MTRFFAGLTVLFLIAGCAEPVREDRTAEWGRDGGAVAFQHDHEGVFVAEKQGQTIAKIFEPDESVLATGRPLYSPMDGRLIFTTAHDLEPQPPQNPRQATSPRPVPPEGNVVWQRPVKYICWLRAEAAGDQQPAPKELFTARCEHMGYIAAGLAVRWHPDGQRVLYLDSTPNSSGQHGIFELDLKTGKTRVVFSKCADAVIFDFTPRGSQLVCVTGANPSKTGGQPHLPSATGIWIGRTDDEKSWWKVPDSDQPAAGEMPSLIESLRATRPAWTADDAKFAFVTHSPGVRPDEPGKSFLYLAMVATKTTRTIHELDGKLADLHWSPNGQTLAFVEHLPTGNRLLRFYTSDGAISEPLNRGLVRQFAGFDHSGARLAYVVPEETGLPDPAQCWSLLLFPNRLARDAVVVAGVDDVKNAAEVFTGMRVTFPSWSPTEDRLSLWVSFVPRYVSLFSLFRGWGLSPGDPAATFAPGTGEISWLAVTPAEELQVGHYYLLKKDYARAWEWYDRARRSLPARQPAADFHEFAAALAGPDRSEIFEYYCLKQLGRHEEAAVRWKEFEQMILPPAPPAGGPPAAHAANQVFDPFDPRYRLVIRLIRDLYLAEVFLSVDAPDAGIELLRDELRLENDDVKRLSGAIALSQLFLVTGRHEEYLSTCTDSVLPLSLGAWNSTNPVDGSGMEDRRVALHFFSGLCLAPLFRSEFLAGIPEAPLRQSVARWNALRPQDPDGDPALAIDLFLRAALLRLEDAAQVEAIEARLARNPATRATFGAEPVDEKLRALFAAAAPLIQALQPR